MQDYMSLCGTAVTCTTLVNTNTDRHATFEQIYY